MKQIKKEACYFRVSSEGQVKDDTIESQRVFLPQWARERGWEVVAEFEDPGITGTKMECRPQFLELLDRGVGAVKYDGEGEIRRLSLEYVGQRLRRISEELMELAGEVEELRKEK